MFVQGKPSNVFKLKVDQYRGALQGQHFLLCNRLLGFNAGLTNVWTPSIDSTNEVDSSLSSILFMESPPLSFRERSVHSSIGIVMKLVWLVGSLGFSDGSTGTWDIVHEWKSSIRTSIEIIGTNNRCWQVEFEVFTLQAIEQKRLGGSCKYLLQASQVPLLFDFVDDFVSFGWGRGFRCTAFSPLILYVCNHEKY